VHEYPEESLGAGAAADVVAGTDLVVDDGRLVQMTPKSSVRQAGARILGNSCKEDVGEGVLAAVNEDRAVDIMEKCLLVVFPKLNFPVLWKPSSDNPEIS
jgi:hypothetical protein